MTKEEVIKLLEGNEDAIKFVGDLDSTKNYLTQQVNSLEVKFNEARDGRDKTKESLRYVKEKLGIDEINDDTLAKALKKKGGDDAELQNLQKLLEEAKAQSKTVETEYKGKLAKYVMQNELGKTGLAQEAYNSKMYQILETEVLKDAVYENDQIIFKNVDGSTLYGDKGKPMALEDRVAMLRSDPTYAPMFKPSNNGGGGSGGSQNGSSSSKVDVGGSKQEQISAIEQRFGLK